MGETVKQRKLAETKTDLLEALEAIRQAKIAVERALAAVSAHQNDVPASLQWALKSRNGGTYQEPSSS